MPSVSGSGVRLATVGLWSSGNAFSGVMNHTLPSGSAPVHKVRFIQKWFVEIGVEEPDWPAQSPDLNLIKHHWDELERRLRAMPNRPTPVPDLTNACDGMEAPVAIIQHLVESLPRRVEAVVAEKEGSNSILIPMILE